MESHISILQHKLKINCFGEMEKILVWVKGRYAGSVRMDLLTERTKVGTTNINCYLHFVELWRSYTKVCDQ